jgi:hypothetical protein
MKFSTLNPREQRTVLGGAAILILGLGWVYAVRPIRASLSDLKDQIAVEREALAREQSAIDEATRSPARKRVADSAMTVAQTRLFSGANDVAAGAALATYLGDVARRSHVWLANAATRPAPTVRPGVAAASEPDGLHRLRVEVRAESDFRGVLDFLNNLERGEKVVTVERLDVAKTLRAGDEDRETLSITATVVGYALPRAALPPVDAKTPAKARPDSAGGTP